MNTTIQQKLMEIEHQQGIEILFACESGSRAWGFPSPDSDYDVRFIYLRKPDDYLSIIKSDDFMNFPLNDELDINGWDLSKALRLMMTSNTTVFEWLQSPIVYKQNEAFRNQFWNLCHHYGCPRSNAHHYLGIAKGAMDGFDSGEIKIKKFFYILRSLLSAQWCVEKQSIAPMNIFPLMELLPDNLQRKILSLIQLKASSQERFIITLDDSLKEWIEKTAASCSEMSLTLEKKTSDKKLADDFFKKTIKHYDNTGNKR